MTDNTPNGNGRDMRAADEAAAVTRFEEEAVVGTETVESGRLRLRKHVETESVEHVVGRRIERAGVGEHVPVAEGDSGEIEVLDDGSVSIPIFEEELVVT